MKLKTIIIVIITITAAHLNAMNRTTRHSFKNIICYAEGGELTKTLKNKIMSKQNDHINGDTLVLKGRIVKADMETQKGTKSEGVQDYYFSSGSNSYFIKTAVGDFSKADLDKLGFEKELTIKCVKKFGNTDIGPQDPSYAATRVGEYIVILEVLP